jgi:hypothetical protein
MAAWNEGEDLADSFEGNKIQRYKIKSVQWAPRVYLVFL